MTRDSESLREAVRLMTPLSHMLSSCLQWCVDYKV